MLGKGVLWKEVRLRRSTFFEMMPFSPFLLTNVGVPEKGVLSQGGFANDGGDEAMKCKL